MKIKTGDTVKVLSGKNRGKIGKVLTTLHKDKRVVVEKVNIVKKHKKQTSNQKDPGGIIEVEAPIDVSNVMIVCSACNKPTRIKNTIKENKKIRTCGKCNEALDQ